MAATTDKKNVGRIEEIQGVVIEAVFPDELPEIYSAITVKREINEEESAELVGGDASILVCEVQQHLGDDRVRAVAMDSTDGLARGMEIVDTGGPITGPVGGGTLGRIFNLPRDPIDQQGDNEVKERRPLHPPAPHGEKPPPPTQKVETGLK